MVNARKIDTSGVNPPLNKPHKHAEIIKAWADGYEIEFFCDLDKQWETVKAPSWHVGLNYRVKQAPPKNKEMDALIVLSPHAGLMLYDAAPDEANCKLVFDGATNKLIDGRIISHLNGVEQGHKALKGHSQWLDSLAALNRTGGR